MVGNNVERFSELTNFIEALHNIMMVLQLTIRLTICIFVAPSQRSEADTPTVQSLNCTVFQCFSNVSQHNPRNIMSPLENTKPSPWIILAVIGWGKSDYTLHVKGGKTVKLFGGDLRNSWFIITFIRPAPALNCKII